MSKGMCRVIHNLVRIPARTPHPDRLPLPYTVDGGWGNWSEWGRCNKECGGGFQLRLRSCNNPAPEHGGKLCVGSVVEERSCNTDPCPVDCEWEEWSEWSTCSASCEGGVESRSRAYKQIALHGGKECNGSNFEQRQCNQHKCPGEEHLKFTFLQGMPFTRVFLFTQMLAILTRAFLVLSAPRALSELMSTSVGLVLVGSQEMDWHAMEWMRYAMAHTCMWTAICGTGQCRWSVWSTWTLTAFLPSWSAVLPSKPLCPWGELHRQTIWLCMWWMPLRVHIQELWRTWFGWRSKGQTGLSF